jgi:hypothetical protein
MILNQPWNIPGPGFKLGHYRKLDGLPLPLSGEPDREPDGQINHQQDNARASGKQSRDE